MKLGFNEATALKCKGQSLITDLELCEKYGYDYIEIRSDCLGEYLKNHTLDELARWFKNHRLKPWAYNTLLFFNQGDINGIDRELDLIIEVANAIGMKMVNTIPSFDIKPLSIGEIKTEAVTRLRYIADRLAPHDIKISLEFCGSYNCSINQFGTAYDVVKETNRANAGITLDTFQFHIMGSRWEDLENAEGKKIFIFHINDVEDLPIGSIPDNRRLWPGDGCINYDHTFGILKEKGFGGINTGDVCTIEVIREEYYEFSLEENIKTAKEKMNAVLSQYWI
jgi:2-keto-myo-inositol isomerase